MTFRTLVSLFFVLAVINGEIFYFRDRFQYIPYSSYAALYKECDADCSREWMQDFDSTRNAEVREARELSRTWLPPTPVPDLEKMALLAGHVHEKFGSRAGSPAADLLAQTPMEQYKTLSTRSSDSLWCGIYSRMFSLFALSQHITTRIIDMSYPGDTHAVSECYLPSLDKWVLVDPTYGLLALKSEEGEWLDLQAFRNELRQNKRIFALTSTGGQLQLKPLDTNAGFLNHYYKRTNSTDYYYHHISLEEAYKPLQKVKRYIFPVSWYRIYNRGNKTNLLFFIKSLFFFSWLLVTIMIMVQLLLGYNRGDLKFKEDTYSFLNRTNPKRATSSRD